MFGLRCDRYQHLVSCLNFDWFVVIDTDIVRNVDEVPLYLILNILSGLANSLLRYVGPSELSSFSIHLGGFLLLLHTAEVAGGGYLELGVDLEVRPGVGVGEGGGEPGEDGLLTVTRSMRLLRTR